MIPSSCIEIVPSIHCKYKYKLNTSKSIGIITLYPPLSPLPHSTSWFQSEKKNFLTFVCINKCARMRKKVKKGFLMVENYSCQVYTKLYWLKPCNNGLWADKSMEQNRGQKNRTVFMGYLVHDKYRFSKLSDGKTDYSTDWIRITSYVLRKKSWTLTFLNKINSKWSTFNKI